MNSKVLGGLLVFILAIFSDVWLHCNSGSAAGSLGRSLKAGSPNTQSALFEPPGQLSLQKTYHLLSFICRNHAPTSVSGPGVNVGGETW